MAAMQFDLFSFQLLLELHLYFKCKHGTPTIIHTEAMWSLFNYSKDTSDIIFSQ